MHVHAGHVGIILSDVIGAADGGVCRLRPVRLSSVSLSCTGWAHSAEVCRLPYTTEGMLLETRILSSCDHVKVLSFMLQNVYFLCAPTFSADALFVETVCLIRAEVETS